MNDFLVVHLRLKPLEPGREILIALLDQIGYDSFEETEAGLKAYIAEAAFDENKLKQIPLLQSGEYEWSYQTERLDTINWNEEWERNYEPVKLGDQVYIRAPFHPSGEGYPHEILIEPKMSFGTGHHQTTRLMARAMLTINFQNKITLDMGTGTGVLAILAAQLGAAKLNAIDNFEWAVENTRENLIRNGVTEAEAKLGDVSILDKARYDVILANINRNVLLADMPAYRAALRPQGKMLLSGFLIKDLDLINTEARRLGFQPEERWQEENWLACLYSLK